MARKFLKFNNCLLAHQKFLFQKISGGKPIFLLARLERTLRRTQCKLEGMWLGNLVMVSTRRKRPPDHNSMQHSLAKGQSCSSNATLPHPTISAGRLPGMHTCLLRLWGGYKQTPTTNRLWKKLLISRVCDYYLSSCLAFWISSLLSLYSDIIHPYQNSVKSFWHL